MPLSNQLSEAMGDRVAQHRRTSDSLASALHEGLSPIDAAKTFGTLAKFGGGLWKSEKQARFLLNAIDSPQFKDRGAEAWANKHGFEGQAFSVMQRIEGYGARDASKTRYWAQVFVVDKYGVVARGKVKVIHPKGDERGLSLDWTDVTVDFKRTAKPEIGVDIHAELRAAVEKNKPNIDLIKTIPGWESKDILVDFLRQLEGGRPLSLGQLAVVQKMVPDKELFLGAKGEWKKHFEGYHQLGMKLLNMSRDTHLAFERGRVPDYEAAIAGGKYWGWSVPEPERLEKQYDQAIDGFKRNSVIPHDVWWIESQMFASMRDLALPSMPAVTMYGTEEVKKQFEKAMKAAKPTKISLSVVMWLQRLAGKVNDESAIKRVADIFERQKQRK